MKTQKNQSVFVALLFSLFLIFPSIIWAQHSQKENRKVYKQNQKQNSYRHRVSTTQIKGNKQCKKQGHNSTEHSYGYSHPKKQYQHYKPNAYRRHTSYYKAKKQYSAVYGCLPQKSRIIYLNGHKYFHHNNHYYMHNATGGYVLVNPPKYINGVPRGSVKVNCRGRNVFAYGGIYFSWTPYGYIIL